MTQTTEQTTQRIMDPETFNALVKQHVDLVYSAAYRQLRDPAQAQDATQAVFILLHRKAPHLDGPIAGWLLKATWYVCRDAKRTAARRRYHERQAMADAPEIASETKSDSMWDVYAPYLDEALTRLKTIDREAITLKFFQNKTNREVGEALALTEEAARKRIDRALSRLHEILSAKAAVPAAVALGAVLAANAVQAAPAGVSAAVLAGTSGVSAAGTSATLLAKSAAKAMAWAKIKVAAIVACVCTATVAITTPVILSQMPPAPAIPPAPVAPAAPPVPAGLPVLVDPDPADLAAPGKVQVVRWDVILNPDVSAQIRSQGQMLKSESKGYQAFLINASVLKKTIAGHGLELASDRMQFSELKQEWLNKRDLRLGLDSSLSFYYPSRDGRDSVEISGGASFDSTEELTRHGNNQLGIKLKYPSVNVSIHEPGQPWRSDPEPHSIIYDGRISAGQALVFNATYMADSGNDYDQLVVWEAFKMPDLLMNCIGTQHSAEYWIRDGVNPLRQNAMNSLVWQNNVPEYSPENPKFTIQLSDGKKVKLVALARQDLWPNIWWDPNGNPLRTQMFDYADGKPKSALSMLLAVNGTKGEIALYDPTGTMGPVPQQQFSEMANTLQSVDTQEIMVGIPVGPWREIAQLKMNQPITIQGATYKISKSHAFDKDAFGIAFDREGQLRDLDQLFPLTANGRTPRYYERKYFAFGSPSKKIHEYPNYMGIPLDQIVSYSLRSRKREYVTFKNYALLPVQQPNTQVTYDEFVRYEIEQRRKQGRERYQSRVYEQQVGLINLFAPRSYPAGSVADRCWSAIQCARRNDEASMLKLFVMDSPEAQRDARIVAQYIMACDRFYMVAQKTYTPQAVYEECESIRHTDLYINMIRTGYYAPKPELAIVDGMFAFRTSDQKNWNFSTADMNPEDLAEMKRAAPVLFELAEQIGQRKISLSQAAAKLIELDE